MNDNILKLLIEEDKESLIWRVELTSKKLSFYLKGGAIVWKTMVPEITESMPGMPSDDKVYPTYARDYVAFTKASGKGFTYEDVKHLMLKARTQRLLRHPFFSRLMVTARKSYESGRSIMNPDRDSYFSEISVKSGLHLFFQLKEGMSVENLQKGEFIKNLQQELKQHARPVALSYTDDELRIIGDEINSIAISAVIDVLIRHDLLLREARDIFINLVMVRHIKDIAQRELRILRQTLSVSEKELFAPYIEIFEVLAIYGAFHYLTSTQLGLLATLYENRKDIYSFPLMIRIPLRSIYICFHLEIQEMLEQAT